MFSRSQPNVRETLTPAAVGDNIKAVGLNVASARGDEAVLRLYGNPRVPLHRLTGR